MTFDRDDWSALRAATPLTLREDDLAKLRGINDRIDLDEVESTAFPDTHARRARIAWIAVLQVCAVDGLGDDAGG